MVASAILTADPVPPPAPPVGGAGLVVSVPVPHPVAATQDVVASTPGLAGLGTLSGYAAWAHSLPLPADDLQRDFGWAIYGQMARDPQIRASLRVLVSAALHQPAQLGVPVPAGHADAPLANRIAAHCREALRRLPRPLPDLLFEMATAALTYGHKRAEVVYTLATLDPAVGPQYVFRNIKVKPLWSMAFVLDGTGNRVGTLVARPGRPLITPGVITAETAADLPLYPDAKFPTLTWDQADEDPRGQSALRAVYGAWWSKQQAYPGLLAYLARFAQPSVDIEMAPNAQDGPGVPGADGTPGPLVPIAERYKQLGLDFQAGGVVVHPAGSRVTLIEATGNGAAFYDAIHLFDSQMTKGLLAQTLATNEAQHQARAAASVHQDILGLLIRYLKDWLAAFVREQVLRPLVRANYGIAAEVLTPEVDLGQTDPQNLVPLLQALAQLAGPGNYWNPAVVPVDVGSALDRRTGFPDRKLTGVGADGQSAPPGLDTGDTPEGSL